MNLLKFMKYYGLKIRLIDKILVILPWGHTLVSRRALHLLKQKGLDKLISIPKVDLSFNYNKDKKYES